MFTANNSTIIAPYGGKLVDLIVSTESRDELKTYADHLPSIQISPRSVCDLELLATGVFSPLDRFMTQEDHERVLNEMRLANGYLFPIPVTLPVAANSELSLDGDIALRNSEYELLAIMAVEEIYQWDRKEVIEIVFGTKNLHHPLVNEMQSWGELNISGRIQVLQLPRHYDFKDMRLTPYQTRTIISEIGPQNVIAVQHRSPMFHDLEHITTQDIEDIDGLLLFQLAVGMTKLGDYDYYTRVQTYQEMADRHFERDQFLLSLLPFATRYGGPREALLQTLIQRNFGANHSLVDRDQASPNNSSGNRSIYHPYEANQLVKKYSHELGVKIVPSQVASDGIDVEPSNSVSKESAKTSPAVSYPSPNINNSSWQRFQQDVAEKLTYAQPSRHKKGVCIWFTGLSGSGKSTTAEMLSWLLLEHDRRITVLDGDIVRTHLSKGLGFSKEDRDTNVRRIGYVASELIRLGGVVICAVVSPYVAARNDVRDMVGQDQFVEVFADTPLEVCEARDVKSIYAKVRNGTITGVTGIDDPYEPPLQPEITLDTVRYTPEENAVFIIKYLIEQGFIHIRKKPNKQSILQRI
ncbi:MAG: adenylyl-sulfate kinase [Candidatus Kariarchaeaceae archaeon]